MFSNYIDLNYFLQQKPSRQKLKLAAPSGAASRLQFSYLRA
jgi:hypothetical protein